MNNKKYTVVKSNALNEMRTNDMSLQELRLLIVYISKINPMDKSTAKVRLTLSEFHTIMNVEMKNLRINYYENITDKLLRKIIKIPYKDGYRSFQLFKTITVARENAQSSYYLEIEAHDQAMPLLFDLQSHYFKYELWYALRLKGRNQLRMYELLKQHEYKGFYVVSVDELKEQLGVNINDYPMYKEFKRNVLDFCKQALQDNTDINYTYIPHSKEGRKIKELRFSIFKNKDFKDPLQLGDYIDIQPPAPIEDQQPLNLREERLDLISDAFHGEYSMVKVTELHDLAIYALPHLANDEIGLYHHCRGKYNQVKRMAEEGSVIKSEYALLLKLIAQRD